MNKTVIITGANGFVGSHMVERAITESYQVIALVRENSTIAYIQDLPIKIVRVDYFNFRDLSSKLERIGSADCLVHCAGVVEADSWKDFQKGNVQVTENILKTVSSSGLKLKRFVYVSSLAARGPKDAPAKSGQDNPITPYGKSKLEAEQVVRSSGLPFIIVRPTAVYGPRDRAFLELVKLLKLRIEISLGAPNRKLTFVHAVDLCKLTFESLRQKDQILYAWDGGVYAEKDVVAPIKAALGIRQTLPIRISKPLFGRIASTMNRVTIAVFERPWKFTPEKVLELAADDWSIDESIDFEPQYLLEEGLNSTVWWYRKAGWI